MYICHYNVLKYIGKRFRCRRILIIMQNYANCNIYIGWRNIVTYYIYIYYYIGIGVTDVLI